MAKLVFLGRLADLAGAAECEVAPGTLEAILAGLPVELAVALLDEKVRIARNGELLINPGSIMVAAGDEIAFLPPVSGG
ncbi:MoaD/ThiS family protein [Novosphingobium ginsenosidimutans]|uniref:MoaD/ThiS family protein n=1 Tax=Novosphingobium ginsenosidimutans TaxID=1176536 RepID=A0A5B8S1U0_9SPHN|nr:MoaD/ThiS family protein [Novosphingobium ginsenosidimutans]QEA15078.1 MoaD/ThiS family protein [Novosphingobium ginsenosidimutans]